MATRVINRLALSEAVWILRLWCSLSQGIVGSFAADSDQLTPRAPFARRCALSSLQWVSSSLARTPRRIIRPPQRASTSTTTATTETHCFNLIGAVSQTGKDRDGGSERESWSDDARGIIKAFPVSSYSARAKLYMFVCNQQTAKNRVLLVVKLVRTTHEAETGANNSVCWW